MKSKRHPNLHSYSNSPNWIFRKYSKAKRAEFVKSTGIEAKPAFEAEAYKRGLELFNEWLGTTVQGGKDVLIRDLSRAVLASKESKKGGKRGRTYRTNENQAKNHVIPAFGYLKPSQLTRTKWLDYDADERRKGRKALFNTRKFLMEVLARAQDEGHIPRVPELPNLDPPPEPPRVVDRKHMRRITRELSANIRLLAYVVYKQGPRPDEVLHYRWDMISFRKGAHGYITIPGPITKNGTDRSIPLNPAISRLLRYLKRGTASEWLFPSKRTGENVKHYNAGWDRACDAVRLDYDVYNLRDTFITEKLAAGISPIFIAKYCQNSAAIIERKYAVPTETVMERVAE